MDIDKSTFLKKYKEQALSKLKIIFPEKEDIELLNIINKQIKEKLDVNTLNVEWLDHSLNKEKSNTLEMFDYLENETPIISGSGSLYHKHEDGVKNILLEMVDMLLKTRKVYKKKKFDHINDEDKTLLQMYDNYQLVYKLLANSFFGSTLEPNSIFFDPFFGSSVMYTGQIIITTALTGFENWVDNFYFDTLDDCLLFIDRIISEEYKVHVDLNIIPTKKDLFNRLKDKFEGKPFNESILKKVISNLSQEQVTKIYYKNNFLKFIENDVIINILNDIVGNEFLDPNSPSDIISDSLNQFWLICKNYVMYNHIVINRTTFCQEHKRNIVLVVDTDSNFLYNKPFTDKVRTMFPDRLSDYEDNKLKRISTVNISMFILTKLIAEIFFHMGKKLNIDEAKRPIINMKNE